MVLARRGLAVKLPCSHLFHEACIQSWLEKQHTCPTCRKQLPTRSAADRRDAAESDERRDDVLAWDDFARPRGTAPMPASGMYT